MRASIVATESSYYVTHRQWIRETFVTVTDLDTGKTYSTFDGVIPFMVLAVNLDKPIEEVYKEKYTWRALYVYVENVEIMNIDVGELFNITPPRASGYTLKRFVRFTRSNIRRSLCNYFAGNPEKLEQYWKFIKHDEYLYEKLAPVYVESKL